MTRAQLIRSAWIAAVALAPAAFVVLVRFTSLGNASYWESQASPGELSSPHRFIEDRCDACHTSGKGPDADKCIACHAANQTLASRQPTAFHMEVDSCRECHPEHQGRNARPTRMDHTALAKIGLRQLKEAPDSTDEEKRVRERLQQWLAKQPRDLAIAGHPGLMSHEVTLDCAACHSTKDKHGGLFGTSCADCHGTSAWKVPTFRHPSPRSTDCAQCHRAPPSHYMGHFHMVSMKVAGKPHAQVRECYQCHLITAWNDIKDVGWYKHH